MNESAAESARSPLTFSIRNLLVVMFLLAIPLSLFRIYWTHVNDTVDERTIAFSSVPLSFQAYLYAAAISLALIVLGFSIWLCRRQYFKLAISMLLLAAIVTYLSTPLVKSKIFEPVNGNPTAETHSNAASIAAIAIIKFYDKNNRWPGGWSDLDHEIKTVLEDLNARQEELNLNPQAFAHVNDVDPYWGNEASQAIVNRSTDLNEITVYTIRKLVDVDFTANPTELATQHWYEFKGITPKKPSYNVYRVEFKKLIEQLSKGASIDKSKTQSDK